MDNINTSGPRQRFVPIATATFTVNLGAAGYVDTDVSATTGTDTRKLWVIVATKAAGAGQAGARATGGAIDGRASINNSTTIYAYCDASGHMELLRDAGGNITYDFIGYLL